MKQKRTILLRLSFLTLLLLSGCVKLQQEMIINEDGSGTLQVALGVETTIYPQFQEAIPEGYELENLLSLLMQNELVTNSVQDQYEDNGWTWRTIRLEISNISELFGETQRIGPILISINEAQGNFIFEESIDVAASSLSIPGKNLMDFSGAEYTVTLTTPYIVDTNGLQMAAGVSTWDVPLSDLIMGEETIFIRAEYSLAQYEGVFIPWESFFSYIVVGFLASGVLAILLVIIINTTRKGEKEDRLKF